MIGYPFQSFYLKTEITRQEVCDKLTEFTFLSDENYKKTPSEKHFYGAVSPIDFELENISKKHAFSNFTRGKILGADHEIYIKLRLGSWQNQRVYFLLLATLFTTLGFLIYYLIQPPQGFTNPAEFYQIYGYGKSEFFYNLTTPISLIMIALIVTISTSITLKYKNFQSSVKPTLNFLNHHLGSTTITKFEVPVLFR
jgi:hypothetical protein